MSSKKLDAAIDALVDALAELPEHELEGWQRGNRLGLRILCELSRRHPGLVEARGRSQVGLSALFAPSGLQSSAPFARSTQRSREPSRFETIPPGPSCRCAGTRLRMRRVVIQANERLFPTKSEIRPTALAGEARSARRDRGLRAD